MCLDVSSAVLGFPVVSFRLNTKTGIGLIEKWCLKTNVFSPSLSAFCTWISKSFWLIKNVRNEGCTFCGDWFWFFVFFFLITIIYMWHILPTLSPDVANFSLCVLQKERAKIMRVKTKLLLKAWQRVFQETVRILLSTDGMLHDPFCLFVYLCLFCFVF